MGVILHVVVTCLVSFPLLANSFDSCSDTNASSCSLAVGASKVEDIEEDERIGAQVSILQVKSKPFVIQKERKEGRKERETNSGNIEPEPESEPEPEPEEKISSMPTDYLTASLPLVWTHVPKCGTSFVNSLVRLPGVCAGQPVGDDVYCKAGMGLDQDPENNCPDWVLWSRCPGIQELTVPGSDQPMKFGAHMAVGSDFKDLYDGHGVIMLRQPEQRLISQYKYMQANEDWKYNFSITYLAPSWAGCAVRMLATAGKGGHFPDCLPDALETSEQRSGLSLYHVDKARRRLRGYSFVGITDEWALSICLLHAMYGGECHSAEFVNTRLRRNSSVELYDTRVLEGFVDPYDGPLYEEALSIFKTNLQSYNVSQKTCAACLLSAGVEISSDASS